MKLECAIAPLAGADAARLAGLHARALPGSLVAKLGVRYGAAFYAYCAASPHETLRVARGADNEILAACVVSARPGDFGARLRRATPLFRAAAGHPLAWPDLARAALLPSGTQPAPQIVLLFADEAARGRGLGRALVDAAAADAGGLYAITENDPANRALAFYRKAGFVDAGVTRANGRAFRLLERGSARTSDPCAE
ncbi:MAG: GNAT family N-acetyltransferase [Tagaea sp.]